MKNLTLKTVSQSLSDISICLNLSLLPDNVISSTEEYLHKLQEQRKLALSKPGKDDIILFCFDYVTLKKTYWSILEFITHQENLWPASGFYASIKAASQKSNHLVSNHVLDSLSIKCEDTLVCKFILPPHLCFMKSHLSGIVSNFLETSGSLGLPLPDFSDDDVSIVFQDLGELFIFQMFIAAELL